MIFGVDPIYLIVAIFVAVIVVIVGMCGLMFIMIKRLEEIRDEIRFSTPPAANYTTESGILVTSTSGRRSNMQNKATRSLSNGTGTFDPLETTIPMPRVGPEPRSVSTGGNF